MQDVPGALFRLLEIAFSYLSLYGKDIHVIPDNVVRRDTYLDLQHYLRETYPSTSYHTFFKSFKELNNKSRHDTVQTMFGLSLLQNNGITEEAVARIMRAFSTSIDFEDWLDVQTRSVRKDLGSSKGEEVVLEKASLRLSTEIFEGRPLLTKVKGQTVYKTWMDMT